MPTVKNVGEPCAGEPHARIDGGREETGTSRHQPRGARRLSPTRPTSRRGPGASQEIANAAGRSVALAAQGGCTGANPEIYAALRKQVPRDRAPDAAELKVLTSASGRSWCCFAL